VRASGITSWSNDAGAPFYFRVSRYQSSYINLGLDVAQVAKHTRTPRPKPMGWTFNPSLRGLSTHHGTDARTTVTGSSGGGTPVEFRWIPGIKAYVRYINGVPQRAADGHRITATNVIVQQCKIIAHPQDRDVLGNPAQFTFTVGRGPVSVFRNGRRINGTWARRHLSSGTGLRTNSGKPLPLMPGNTWVILVKRGNAVSG
jgi:hypothetical protein